MVRQIQPPASHLISAQSTTICARRGGPTRINRTPVVHFLPNHHTRLKMKQTGLYILLAVVVGSFAENTRLKEVFSWKTVEYEFPKAEDRATAIKTKVFIQENNLPLGLDVWRDKLFITVPRWKGGVFSSLNYVNIADMKIPNTGDNDDDDDNENEGGLVGDVTDTVGGEADTVDNLLGGEDGEGILGGATDTVDNLLGGGDGEGLLGGATDTVDNLLGGGDGEGLLGGATDTVDNLLGGGDGEGLLGGATETVDNLLGGEDGDGLLGSATDTVDSLLGGGDGDGLISGATDTVDNLLGGGDGEGLLGGATDTVDNLLGGGDGEGLLGGASDTVDNLLGGEDGEGLLGGATDTVDNLLGGEDGEGLLGGATDTVDNLLGGEGGDGLLGGATDTVDNLLGGEGGDGLLGGATDTVDNLLEGEGGQGPLGGATDTVDSLLGGEDGQGPLGGATDTVDNVLGSDDNDNEQGEDASSDEGNENDDGDESENEGDDDGDEPTDEDNPSEGLLPPEDETEITLPEDETDVEENPDSDVDDDATPPTQDEEDGEEDLIEPIESDDEPPEVENEVEVPPTDGEEDDDANNEDEEDDDEEEDDEETSDSEEESEERKKRRRFQLRLLGETPLGMEKYGGVAKIRRTRSVVDCAENNEMCQQKEVLGERKTKNRKSSKKNNSNKRTKVKGEMQEVKEIELMEPVKISKSKSKKPKAEEIFPLEEADKKPKSGREKKGSDTKNTKTKLEKKRKSKNKKAKKNNKEAVAATDEVKCNNGRNPCGIPIPEPVYAEVTLKPPESEKNKQSKEDCKKEKKKSKKKKQRKDCEKAKKPKKPKKECVKPPKVTASSPALIPYPNIEVNTLKEDCKEDCITSVFRVRVDACDRLWVMDTGVADILGDTKVYSKPQILIYNLLTDKLIKKYVFPSNDVESNSFFANIVVDAEKDKCDDAFAYVPDLGSYAIVVYDFKNDKSWRIKHNYFHFDPLQGNYNVGKVNFQWTDGVFSVALTSALPDGSRTAYFHALSSINLFKVNTHILQNPAESSDSNYTAYSLVGSKGQNGQSSASFIHEPTGVMFYTQVNKDAIYCWNTNKEFKDENLEEVASDSETMVFPNDLKVDHNGLLWVLTDRLPVFTHNKLDSKDVNYRIFVSTVADAIKNTNCAP